MGRRVLRCLGEYSVRCMTSVITVSPARRGAIARARAHTHANKHVGAGGSVAVKMMQHSQLMWCVNLSVWSMNGWINTWMTLSKFNEGTRWWWDTGRGRQRRECWAEGHEPAAESFYSQAGTTGRVRRRETQNQEAGRFYSSISTLKLHQHHLTCNSLHGRKSTNYKVAFIWTCFCSGSVSKETLISHRGTLQTTPREWRWSVLTPAGSKLHWWEPVGLRLNPESERSVKHIQRRACDHTWPHTQDGLHRPCKSARTHNKYVISRKRQWELKRKSPGYIFIKCI